MKILVFVGSLRKDSVNRKAALALAAEFPKDVAVEFADFSGFPLYNQDIQDQGFPESVTTLGRAIAASDGIVFSTPEYNYSVPGVLKNAIDWISRLTPQPFKGKTAVIIGASPGQLGSARAQYHLRQIGVFLDLRFLNTPEAMIAGAYGKFDATGKLTDEPTRQHLKKVADTFISAVTEKTDRV